MGQFMGNRKSLAFTAVTSVYHNLKPRSTIAHWIILKVAMLIRQKVVSEHFYPKFVGKFRYITTDLRAELAKYHPMSWRDALIALKVYCCHCLLPSFRFTSIPRADASKSS